MYYDYANIEGTIVALCVVQVQRMVNVKPHQPRFSVKSKITHLSAVTQTSRLISVRNYPPCIISRNVLFISVRCMLHFCNYSKSKGTTITHKMKAMIHASLYALCM